MAGATHVGTIRHLGTEYKLVSQRHPDAAQHGVTGSNWAVVEIATGRVWRYKTGRGAWLRRKALIAGVSVKVARGLPS